MITNIFRIDLFTGTVIVWDNGLKGALTQVAYPIVAILANDRKAPDQNFP
jgi:hypothetical protein